MPETEVGPLREAVLEIVVRFAPPDIAGSVAVDEKTLLREDLGYDSLALAELAFALEERFGLPTLPSEETADVATAGDVADLVAGLAEQGALLPGTEAT
ncbi:phosphopantetheine-binding protein [Actinocorallia sp. B10E7]|uniref:phosphopantetheine-binding protein n=1 Tax=Actinocorallia sp. B10E7 TaxID=3153558 RepID=UPI00325E3F76